MTGELKLSQIVDEEVNLSEQRFHAVTYHPEKKETVITAHISPGTALSSEVIL